MPAERLLASYIVRVLVREGKRSITLYDVRNGETQTFSSYRAMLEGLGQREEAQVRRGDARENDA